VYNISENPVFLCNSIFCVKRLYKYFVEKFAPTFRNTDTASFPLLAFEQFPHNDGVAQEQK
jgi:hypothetical protein